MKHFFDFGCCWEFSKQEVANTLHTLLTWQHARAKGLPFMRLNDMVHARILELFASKKEAQCLVHFWIFERTYPIMRNIALIHSSGDLEGCQLPIASRTEGSASGTGWVQIALPLGLYNWAEPMKFSSRSQQTVSTNGQMVYILGFEGHRVSIATTKLCWWSAAVQRCHYSRTT